jgi:hypothetical protein
MARMMLNWVLDQSPSIPVGFFVSTAIQLTTEQSEPKREIAEQAFQATLTNGQTSQVLLEAAGSVGFPNILFHQTFPKATEVMLFQVVPIKFQVLSQEY